MEHESKFILAINRLHEQLERDDYVAAFHTLKLTNYLPVKAFATFVRKAPESLVVKILYDFKCYCMNELNRENVFDRSVNLSVLLKLSVERSIIAYFREKQQLFATIEQLGVPVPLLVEQTARSTEEKIKQEASHAKLLASGFTRVYCDRFVSKYVHPELPATLVVHTPKAEKPSIHRDLHANEAFVCPQDHEGWLALGFSVKQQSRRVLYYARFDTSGKEECYAVLYPSLRIATRHFRNSAIDIKDSQK